MAGLCGLLGFAAGVALSVFFIFPGNVLSIKLAALTLDDILRTLAGIFVSLVMAALGVGCGKIIGRDSH